MIQALTYRLQERALGGLKPATRHELERNRRRRRGAPADSGPDVVGRFADAMLPAEVADPRAAFRLAQRPQNLLMAVYAGLSAPDQTVETLD
jgi:hypothetical protein